MSRPPFERKATAGIVVPVVAIAAALAIGAIVKRDTSETRPSFQYQAPIAKFPGAGVTLAAAKSGLGAPKTPSGNVPSSQMSSSADDSVAWARFDLSGSLTELLQFRRSVMLTLVDGEGKHWPFDELWLGNSVYLLVPPGYAEAPNKLYAHLSVFGRELSNLALPSLPVPTKRQFRDASQGWKGLAVESVRLLSDQRKARRIFIDSPLSAGNVLTATLWGTPFWDPKLKSKWVVRGPDPGRYFQVVDLALWYPDSSPQAFLEITELRPVHTRKRIHLDDIPIVEKFDLPWVVKESPNVPFSAGVSFRIAGVGNVPYRLGRKPPRNVALRLASQGLVRHVKATLISPTLANGTPLRIESRTFSEDGIGYSPTPANWTGGPLNVVMDIEADVYEVVRKAQVVVDLTKPRTIPDPVSRMINPLPLSENQRGLMPTSPIARFSLPMSAPQIVH